MRPFVLAFAATLAAWATAAAAQAPIANQVLILADSLSHDQEGGIVSAAGSVELTSGDRTLLADRIEYDARGDRVRAIGNVALLEPGGDVLFADELELRDELRNGFISGIRVLLSDRSRMAASSAMRNDGNRTEMYDAIFTACDSCAGDPNPPVWQVRAARIIHDHEARRIDYLHARLEFLGIPVAYTPFFSHPDPSVIRQSGFLSAAYGNSTSLGTTIEVPYYYALAPHRDVTLSPIFTSREGIVLAGEYRERTRRGTYQFEGSITHPDERGASLVKTGNKATRSHLRGNGEFVIDDTWQWGFAAARASDDTYLRRYGFSSEDTLVTNAFLEGIDDRNYAAVNAWSFQGLAKDDDPGQSPLVLPMIDYTAAGHPGRYGETVTVDANLLALTRNEGVDSWRVSSTAEWRLPYTAPMGDVYVLTASLRGDGYIVSGVEDADDPSGPSVDGFVGRILPRVSLDWRFPFVAHGDRARYLVEPVVTTVVAPYGGNSDRIPNEDSLSFEFDDTNLLDATRFPGLDRWEGGPRVSYGVRLGAYGARSTATAMIGQTARAHDDETFDERSGLGDSPSDYVGRIALAMPNIVLNERFRADRRSLSLRRNEVGLTLGPEDLQIAVGYVYLSPELSSEDLGRREELTIAGRARLNKAWSATASSRHDLSDPGGLLLSSVGLVYECDCMNISIDFTRRLTSDRDVPASSSVTLRVRLRHLG